MPTQPTQLVCYLSSLSTSEGSPYLLQQPSSTVQSEYVQCRVLIVLQQQWDEISREGGSSQMWCLLLYLPPWCPFPPHSSFTHISLIVKRSILVFSRWMQIGLKCLLTNCLTGSNVCWSEFKVIIFLPCKICGKVCGGGGRLPDFGSKADRSTCKHTLQYQIWTNFQIVNYTSLQHVFFHLKHF